MPKIAYCETKPRAEKLVMIQQAIKIINEYKTAGYNLTLRQVYYQFVARGLIPNKQEQYKKLGDAINDGRMCGLIDWHAIEDRTRERGGNAHWGSPQDIINAVERSYMIDKWADQDYRPEVWVEKDALEGVVGTICRRLDIPFFSCRGYTSQTAMWDNAQIMKDFAEKGQTPVILHLGDHDPSGIDMSRDIEARVRLFMGDVGEDLIFSRIALNMGQIEQYTPPPNPAKTTDSRFAEYQRLHGDESWELDALEPTVISDLIEDAIKAYRDDDKFDDLAAKEKTERAFLGKTAKHWTSVVTFLNKKP